MHAGISSKIQVSSIIYLQRQLNSNHYSLSGDLKYVLLEYSRVRLYRHSFTAQYSIYSLDKSSYSPLSLSGDVDIADRLQMARWSPSGHALAVVRDNDLYYLPDISARPERLTNSGRPGLIFNGIADWLYEGKDETIFKDFIPHPDNREFDGESSFSNLSGIFNAFYDS